MEKSWTLIELLNTTYKFFLEKEIENPRGSSEALLGKALNLSRIQLYLQHDRPLTTEEISSFRELVKRRAKREPLQLILGKVDFYGLELELIAGLLIPRPETEELAKLVIDKLGEFDQQTQLKVLDIGTGTGCLAAAIAKSRQHATVDAVDIDYEAVKCCKRNAELHGVGDRVRAIHCDIFAETFLERTFPKYDLIVSNPPYIPESELPFLQEEVKHFESYRALSGGASGLIFYERIAALLPALLTDNGFLALEIGINQVEKVREIFGSCLQKISVRNDFAGIPRIVSGVNKNSSLSIPSNL